MWKKQLNKVLLPSLAVSLVGCEAPLNLEGVKAEQQKPFHRYDQFQAATNNGDFSVVVGAMIDVTACPDGSFAALAMDRKLWVADKQAANWQVKTIETMEEVLALDCNNKGYWVTGSFSTILSSADGGASWNENSLGEDAQLTTIQFLDDNNGFATGEFGVVLKTTDAGGYWEAVEYLPGEFYPQASYFRDMDNGWVVGLAGSIMHTSDGGMSWQQQESGTEAPLYGIDGVADKMIIVGENGTMLNYQQGQWQPLSGQVQALAYLRAVDVQDDAVIAAGGSGSVLSIAQ
jgi:photosystem II stability/assembly factor-like uncharacterized protein